LVSKIVGVEVKWRWQSVGTTCIVQGSIMWGLHILFEVTFRVDQMYLFETALRGDCTYSK